MTMLAESLALLAVVGAYLVVAVAVSVCAVAGLMKAGWWRG